MNTNYIFRCIMCLFIINILFASISFGQKFYCNQDAVLLFNSGFEYGTVISSCNNNDCLRGTDESVPEPNDWYEDIDGSSFIGENSIQYQGGTEDERTARIIEDPNNISNSVLEFAMYESWDGMARIQANIYDSDESTNGLNKLYQKVRLNLAEGFDTFLNEVDRTTDWLTIFEVWNDHNWNEGGYQSEYPFRIKVDIVKKEIDSEEFYFQVTAHKYDYDKYNGWNNDNPSLQSTNFDIPVSINEWMTIEYYIKDGDSSDGRFFMSVKNDEGQRQVVFDEQTYTQHPNHGNDIVGIKMWNPMKLYTHDWLVDSLNNHESNLRVYWDDLEIWRNKKPKLPLQHYHDHTFTHNTTIESGKYTGKTTIYPGVEITIAEGATVVIADELEMIEPYNGWYGKIINNGELFIDGNSDVSKGKIKVGSDKGNLTICQNSQLSNTRLKANNVNIKPGVNLLFGTDQGIEIHGKLKAIGAGEPIVFDQSGSERWEGIDFSGATNSKIHRSEVRNANNGIRVTGSSTPFISKSVIEDNQTGIRFSEYFGSDYPEILVNDNNIRNNNTGISMNYSSNIGIKSNQFKNNEIGIFANNSSTLVQNNLFENNISGFSSMHSSSQLVRNKMISEFTGLNIQFSSYSTVQESDIYPGSSDDFTSSYSVRANYGSIVKAGPGDDHWNFGPNYWGENPTPDIFHAVHGSDIKDYFPAATSAWNNYHIPAEIVSEFDKSKDLTHFDNETVQNFSSHLFENDCKQISDTIKSMYAWQYGYEAQLVKLAGCYLRNEKSDFMDFFASEVKSQIVDKDRVYATGLNLEGLFHIYNNNYEKAHEKYLRMKQLFKVKPNIHKLALFSLVYLNHEHLKNQSQANKYFRQLFSYYPDSEVFNQINQMYRGEADPINNKKMHHNSGDLPKVGKLHKNYPNPFNPTTLISYDLPETSNVRLEVYDLLGRKVATLVNDQMEAGSHEVLFDATNLASGIYIFRITTSQFTKTRQMTLVK